MATSSTSSSGTAGEDTLQQLEIERDVLRKALQLLKHKETEKTKQVVECGKKITKVLKELAEVKAAAEETELCSQLKVKRLQKECDTLRDTNEAQLEIGRLQNELEVLKDTNKVLIHKNKTQTGQVQGCEKKVAKVVTELAEVKATAHEKEVSSQLQIERLHTTCDILKRTNDTLRLHKQSQKCQLQGRDRDVAGASKGQTKVKVAAQKDTAQLQCTNDMHQKRLDDDEKPSGSFSIQRPQEPFEDSVEVSGKREESSTQLEGHLAAIKAILNHNEQIIKVMKEENMRLKQARENSTNLDQGLKRPHTQIECTAGEDGGSVTGSASGEVVNKKRIQRAPTRPFGQLSQDANSGCLGMSDEQANDWLDANLSQMQ